MSCQAAVTSVTQPTDAIQYQACDSARPAQWPELFIILNIGFSFN